MRLLQKTQQQIIALIFIASALSLSACGWHLRGLEPLPEGFESLYLSTPDKSSEVSRALARSLKAMGVDLKDNASEAPITLKVTNVKQDRRTVSTSGRGKAAEYELTSQITYEIKNRAGSRLFGPDTVSTEKTYLFDPDRVVSAFEEEQILRKEMQRDLIQQLVRRYQAAKLQEQPEAK